MDSVLKLGGAPGIKGVAIGAVVVVVGEPVVCGGEAVLAVFAVVELIIEELIWFKV